MVDPFIVRRYARLRCYDNYDNIDTINWFKNEILYDPESDNGEFQYNKSYISFPNVKQRVSGNYKCQLVFKNGQHLMSNNSVQIDVLSKIFFKINFRCKLLNIYRRDSCCSKHNKYSSSSVWPS
jgi:hypothetical protein